jgi:hypothetical protein
VGRAARGDYRQFRAALELLDVNRGPAPEEAVDDRRARAMILATRPSHHREVVDAGSDGQGYLAFVARFQLKRKDVEAARRSLEQLEHARPGAPEAADLRLRLLHAEGERFDQGRRPRASAGLERRAAGRDAGERRGVTS